MSRGLPYDSDGGRDYAAALTALMTGEGYAQSARIARDCGGPFSGYEKNREPCLRVMRKHGDTPPQVDAIIDFIDVNETIEGAPGLKDSHLPVFDCAFKASKGQRSIQ